MTEKSGWSDKNNWAQAEKDADAVTVKAPASKPEPENPYKHRNLNTDTPYINSFVVAQLGDCEKAWQKGFEAGKASVKIPSAEKPDCCYQYIIQDNQQTCYNYYFLSKKSYLSMDACRKDYEGDKHEGCFRVIAPLMMSEQSGELAWHLTRSR